jgi:putative FmdB family regulatory protein
MAEYEFECRRCRKIFTLFMRVTERAAAKIRCPGCDSADVEPLMQPFLAKTAKKS